MKNTLPITQLVREVLKEMKNKTKQTYDYGCVMLYFDFKRIDKIHSLIDEQDIFRKEDDKSFGLEDEPHCTLLYGLHEEVDIPTVKEIVDRYAFETCRAVNPSLFENEEFDVLKFNVEGKYLHDSNKALKDLPHTSTYPNYTPHLTIAYLKSGTGKKYVKLIREKFEELLLEPSHIRFSHPDGSKTEIKLKK